MEITKEWIDQQRAICAAATHGPWEWYISTRLRDCRLQTSNDGKRFVMTFTRWGMGDAAPMFCNGYNEMERADAFAKSIPGREHHVGFDDYVNHPDAKFISNARTALPVSLDALEAALADADQWKRDYGSAIELLAEKKKQIDALTSERDAARDVLDRIDYQLEKNQTYAAMGNRQYAHGIRDARKIIAQMLPPCTQNTAEDNENTQDKAGAEK